MSSSETILQKTWDASQSLITSRGRGELYLPWPLLMDIFLFPKCLFSIPLASHAERFKACFLHMPLLKTAHLSHHARQLRFQPAKSLTTVSAVFIFSSL